MATTEQSYIGDGNQVNFSLPFPYLLQTDVTVTVDNVVQTLGAANDYVFSQSNQITFNVAPPNQSAILFKRETSAETLPVDFSAGTALRAVDLNNNFKQNLYIAQETQNLTVAASSGALADGSVTNAKIATGAVSEAKLASNSVTNTKLGSLSVSSDKIQNSAITETKLSNNSVTSDKIVDNTIVNADINAAANIAGTKISAATNTVRGTVKLIDSVTDTSTDAAATANSVKQVNDAVNALVSGGWVPLETIEVTSTVSSVEFTTGITDLYNNYVIVCNNYTGTLTSQVTRLKTSGTAIANGYRTISRISTVVASTSGNQISATLGLYSNNFIAYYLNLRSSGIKSIISESNGAFSSTMYSYNYTNTLISTDIIDGIQIFPNTGSITSGTFTLYGLSEAS